MPNDALVVYCGCHMYDIVKERMRWFVFVRIGTKIKQAFREVIR